MRKLVAVLLFCIIATTTSFAQFKRQREYSGFFDTYYYRGPITFTLGGGMTTFRGDLVEGLGLNGLSYGFSLGANYKIWPHIVLGAELSYLNFQAKDFNTSRGLSFKTTAQEFQIYGRFYLIDEIIRVSPDRRKESHYTFCKPYVHIGIGGMFFDPDLDYSSSPQYITGTGSNGMALLLPAGLGLQFTITQRSSFCLEYVYRFTNSDYLDFIPNSKNDGYGLLQAKFQFAPTAPKRKKKLNLPPPTQYDGPKGTETWKTKKQQEQQSRPRPQEYEEIPESTDEQNTDEENTEEQPAEEIQEVTPE